MSVLNELIEKLREEIHRCELGKADSRKEYDSGRLSLAALNVRLTEYDNRIAALQAKLHAVEVEPQSETTGARWDAMVVSSADAEPEAREIRERLTGAGLTVCQDVDAIHSTNRLVLLLTPEAMTSADVFARWFYFHQEHRPIHCLLVQACSVHDSLLPYGHLDWREQAGRDWERLLRDLRAPFLRPPTVTPSPIVSAPASLTSKPERPFADLLEAARDPEGSIALPPSQIRALSAHSPADLAEYRLGRIAEWSQPRYALDSRFVQLSLLLDQGEADPQRWRREDYRFSDLRQVLDRIEDPALVLLGVPGSGKSTLLRRLQMDLSLDELREERPAVTFFIQLNGYRGEQEPRAWLATRWRERYPLLPPLDTFLGAGHALLLLDALNEMPHHDDAEYHERVALWRAFIQDVTKQGNRAIFSCRSLDYSASLSSKDLRVPQIEVERMSEEKVRQFIEAYSPVHAAMIWSELDGSPQFDLFRTPIYLKLLLDQTERLKRLPKGKAELFTQCVRQTLIREIEADNRLLLPDSLLTARDTTKLAQGRWGSPFDLPERGALIPALSRLAFSMQQRHSEGGGAQVRIAYDDACDLLAHDRAEDILSAGNALALLDEDVAREEIVFFHQLLQEYFAARRLARDPDPTLVHTEWSVEAVRPSLEETLAGLPAGDPLPPLPQTGWEETALTAAPMACDPGAFIRDLMPHNLPLAARCAASPEVEVGPDLKRDLQRALIARTQDMRADLRARIAAGLALGEIGDPRFERRTGPYGAYLLPPLVTIEGGTYPMGWEGSRYPNERPARNVGVATFRIGQFPVTNAEYALFVAAKGYEDEQWWDTEAARAWLRGKAFEEERQSYRDRWRIWHDNWTSDEVRALVPERMTPDQADTYVWFRELSEEGLEGWLLEQCPEGKIYRKPAFWDDARFTAPSQPVVGVSWYEARAYCKWLSANALAPEEQPYGLPTEAQFEAAARGLEGRLYPYGPAFDVARSNTFESHIRRTTPVGVFDNRTPEGAYDLSGNAYTWTTSLYDQERFPYPYRAGDGRENPEAPGRRVVRGGSWYDGQDLARAVCRSLNHPTSRGDLIGFRVVRPPSR